MFNNKNKLIIIFASLVLFSIFPPSADQPRAGYFSAFGGPATGWLFSIPAEAASPLKLQIQFPCPDFPGANCPASPEKSRSKPGRLYRPTLSIRFNAGRNAGVWDDYLWGDSIYGFRRQHDPAKRCPRPHHQALWGVAFF